MNNSIIVRRFAEQESFHYEMVFQANTNSHSLVIGNYYFSYRGSYGDQLDYNKNDTKFYKEKYTNV